MAMSELPKDVFSGSYEEAIPLVQEILKDELPTASYLRQFRIKDQWFAQAQAGAGLHGIGHETRVLVLVNLLFGLIHKTDMGSDLMPYERDALSGSAVTHDTQRIVHDDYDFFHGKRAADWVARRYLFDTSHRDEYLSQVDPIVLYYIRYIDEHHDPEDTEDTMSILLAIFKDADALERFRDEENGNFDPKYLRFESTEFLIPIAKELYTRSAKLIALGMDQFDAGIQASMELGIVKNE